MDKVNILKKIGVMGHPLEFPVIHLIISQEKSELQLRLGNRDISKTAMMEDKET
jgi:hypothetical protein